MDSSDRFWINLDRHILGLVVVQSLNCVQFFATPWTVTYQASLSFTIFWSLLKLMSTESVMPSNHVVPSVVPFSSCPQAFPASGSFPIVVSMKLLFLKHVYLGELLSGPSPFPNQVCKACFMLQILHGPTLICVNPSHP